MRRAAILLVVVAASACTPLPPPVTAPATLAHPDYLFPEPPAGTTAPVRDRLQRAWFLLQRGEAVAADREFAALLREHRGFVPAVTGQAYAALAGQHAGAAVTAFEAAVGMAPDYVPALVGRGMALLAAGRGDDALAAFEAAAAVAPATPDLAALIDALRVRQSQDRVTRAERAAADERWDEAREAYLAAIAASPESAFLYRDLAGVERRAGNGDAALEHARRATTIDRDDVRAHLLLGQLLADRSDFTGAIAAYERASSIESSAAVDRALEEVRVRAREAALPEEFRTIERRPEVSRGEVAALLGVRLPELLARAPQRQVVITDARNHWALPWIQASVRAGAMDVFANYEFQAAAPVRRADLAEVVSRVLTLADGASSGQAAAPPGAARPIADVAPDHLAFPAVRRAVDAGVLTLEDGAFHLLRPVSGEEAVQAVDRLVALVGARQ